TLVLMTQRLDQEALVRLAGHDDRSRVAAGAEAFARVQAEATLGFLGLGRVTGIALGHQHGADSLLKEGKLIRSRQALGRTVAVARSPGRPGQQAGCRQRQVQPICHRHSFLLPTRVEPGAAVACSRSVHCPAVSAAAGWAETCRPSPFRRAPTRTAMACSWREATTARAVSAA